MQRKTILWGATALAAAAALSLSAAYALTRPTPIDVDPANPPSGYSALSFEAPHHGHKVKGAIWYPAADARTGYIYAENGVFQGVPVTGDAAPRAGQHPVVLLSHGMGGEVRALAWLATALAARGAIVVGVTHPNSNWQDFDLAQGMKHWTRAQDLSAALDAVQGDDRFAGRIDESRIMAAGFSYGGWTALSLGGLRGNLAGYLAHCAEQGAASSYCDDAMGEAVQLGSFDPEAWNGDYSDPRVDMVAALDPGFVWGLSPEDAAGMVGQVRMIGLGDANTRLIATDFEGSGLDRMIKQARTDWIVPAVHFSAMPLCKPEGPAILEREGDDPVCTDPAGADRAAIHARIIDLMAGDLGL